MDTNNERDRLPLAGESAALGMQFCPLLAVVKLPYKFMQPPHTQEVATLFFDAGKIWNHEWDLYYIFSEENLTAKPIVFIPETQFQALIDQINVALPDLKWTLTNEFREKGLLINFTSTNDDLRPRWLGHCNSRERYETLVSSIQIPTKKAFIAEMSDITTFKDNIDRAADISKNRWKRSKQSKNTDQQEGAAMAKMTAAQVQLNHAYSHLGLSRAVSERPEDTTTEPTSKEDIVFIAIDIEAFERDHRKVTEVGIATLDTRDTQHVAMGQDGEAWRRCIRARHFRIHEYKHLVNRAFVKGCPEDFEFGDSETVALADLPKVLASCFRHPYSNAENEDKPEEQRNIVLVGHDINQDINYCHQIGFSVLNRSSIVEVLDTATMYRAFTRDKQPRSLANIILDFELDAWFLHNAGNDAVYTLWALIGMCCTANLKQEVGTSGSTSKTAAE